MNTNIEVMLELDELVEAARLLGATQAKRGFGCHTDEDSRFERAMYESIDKHRAALLAERDALAAEVERLAEALRLALKWVEVVPPGEPLNKECTADLAAARAALAQESSND